MRHSLLLAPFARVIGVGATMTLTGITGCGSAAVVSDAGLDAPRVDAPAAPLVDIVATVNAPSPSFTGRVLIGVFRANPPTMPPVASVRMSDPTFPFEATLRDVEPGTYHVLGVLDYDPPSPTIPGPEDTTASVGPIDVDGSMDIAVSLTLPATM